MYDKQNTGLGPVLLLLSFILSIEESLKNGNVGQCKMKEGKDQWISASRATQRIRCHHLLLCILPQYSLHFNPV